MANARCLSGAVQWHLGTEEIIRDQGAIRAYGRMVPHYEPVTAMPAAKSSGRSVDSRPDGDSTNLTSGRVGDELIPSQLHIAKCLLARDLRSS